MLTHVHPAPVSPVTHTATPTATAPTIVYTLVGHHTALRCIDGRKTIKNALLPVPLLCPVNRLLHRTKRLLPLLYILGLLCSALVPALPRDHGTWLAPLAPVLCLPAILASSLALRYDMVVLIGQTFEFWCATALNVASTALMCAMLGDVRALVPLTSCIGFEIPFLIDAIYRAPHAAITLSVVGACVLTYLVVCISLRLVRDTHATVVFRSAQRELLAEDVIANALATVVVLLLRNAYRKHQVVKRAVAVTTTIVPAVSESTGVTPRGDDDSNRRGAITPGVATPTVVAVSSCIMYRCRLELRDVRVQLGVPPPACLAATTGGLARLVFAGSTTTFDAQHVLLPKHLATLSLVPWSRRRQRILNLVGAIGLVATTVVPYVAAQLELPSHAFVLTGFACTVLFAGVYAAHYQRQLLLYELGASFDYLFLSAQSLFAHACLCDLYHWDARCLAAAASVVWVQWLLSLDATTPVMKHKLGFTRTGALAVSATVLLEQLVLVVHLVLVPSDTLRERVLFTVHVAGRAIDVRVVPLLLSRLFTTFLWLTRIAWRLASHSERELLVLQGQVQYDDRELGSRRHVGRR